VDDLWCNAVWTVMDEEEQCFVKPAVTEFAVWCMSNFAYGNKVHVGMKGVQFIYKMAAGCMQQDDQRLIEADRSSLNDLGLGQTLLSFGDSSHDNAEKVDWLFDRLQRLRGDKRKLHEAASALSAV